MNKYIFNFFLIIFSVGGLTSCATQQNVVSYTNDDANFKKYQSYNIVNYKKSEQKYSLRGELFIQKLEAGISAEMDNRNYEKSTSPDIIVRYEIISSVNVKTSNSNINQSNRFGNINQFNTPINNSSKHIEGVLLIELKDKKTRKLIWQASLDLKYSRKKEKNEALLPNAIRTIFEKYKYVAGSDKPIQES